VLFIAGIVCSVILAWVKHLYITFQMILFLALTRNRVDGDSAVSNGVKYGGNE